MSFERFTKWCRGRGKKDLDTYTIILPHQLEEEKNIKAIIT